ncbi:MFS transporter, partial [Bacteroidota bacterium]
MYKNKNIYGLQFWMLCLSSVLFFGSFNMIIPELPSYLDSLGGEDYKGLIIALFTLTAGLSRPFSGKLTDTVGRIPIMIYGVIVCFVVGFLYPVLTTVAGFLFLRFIHGMSTGFKPTATSAYIADISPFNRRGEALGVLGFFGSLGMASGPVLGSYIASAYSLNAMFYTSSVIALMSIAVLIGMKETLERPQKFKLSLLKIKWSDVIEPRVIPPAIVIMLTTFSFGVILTIVPDLSDHLDLPNKGIFFAIFTVTSLITRILGGKASDIYGRIPILMVACVVYIVSLILLGMSDTLIWFYSAAALYGIGVGFNTPTAFAWTIDLSDEEHRGRGMATAFISLEIGIGMGAILSAWIYA